jgi:spore coat-associated protein N
MRLDTTSKKLVASGAVIAAAAAVAGLGTFGSFTSSTSASTEVKSGTVKIELGAANDLSIAATGLVPGDTVARPFQLSNTGSENLATLTLSTVATTTSKLDTDATNGLQLTIQDCPVAWTKNGTTYNCAGGATTVLPTQPIVGANKTLTGSNLGSLTANGSDFLLATATFPTNADNTFQAQSSVVGFTFTGTQRTATAK